MLAQVSHVNFDDPGTNHDDDLTWFYGARGSGIFMDLDMLRQHGRVMQGRRADLGVQDPDGGDFDDETFSSSALFIIAL